jgi:hypothetical protein
MPGTPMEWHGGGVDDALKLNGFVVDPRLVALMRRADWRGKRTSEAWLRRFPVHPIASNEIPFVEFCSWDSAVFENANIRFPEMSILRGRPNQEFPPGDFDPYNGYLIGFTESVDAGIFVDLRTPGGGAIIYDNLHNGDAIHATAFSSINEFVRFYVEQHGSLE